MKISPIGLAAAAALTIASLNSASAGFASRQRFVGPIRPAIASQARENRFRQARRFEPRGAGAFRRDRSEQLLFFPSAYQDAPASSPAADGELFGFGAAPPIINVTFVAAAPREAYAGPPIYRASAGPKIIIVGARPRSAHFKKMPIVVYGTARASRSY